MSSGFESCSQERSVLDVMALVVLFARVVVEEVVAPGWDLIDVTGSSSLSSSIASSMSSVVSAVSCLALRLFPSPKPRKLLLPRPSPCESRRSVRQLCMLSPATSRSYWTRWCGICVWASVPLASWRGPVLGVGVGVGMTCGCAGKSGTKKENLGFKCVELNNIV